MVWLETVHMLVGQRINVNGEPKLVHLLGELSELASSIVVEHHEVNIICLIETYVQHNR